MCIQPDEAAHTKGLPKERERRQTKLALGNEEEQAVRKGREQNLHGLFPAARRGFCSPGRSPVGKAVKVRFVGHHSWLCHKPVCGQVTLLVTQYCICKTGTVACLTGCCDVSLVDALAV